VATLGLGGYLAGRLDFDRAPVAAAFALALVAAPILLATSHVLPLVALGQTVLALLLAIIGIHAGRLLHDAVPSGIRAGVSSGAGTFSWLLFLPFSLVFGGLARSHGVHWAGWVLLGVTAVLALLMLVVAARERRTVADPDVEDTTRLSTIAPPPVELACRELVTLVSDYLDGVLPAQWRTRVEQHLSGCDGCSAYLEQIRAALDVLAQLDVESRTSAPSGPPTER
jgi:MFS family permease